MSDLASHIVDALLAAGAITRQGFKEAYQYSKNNEELIEEALIETGAVDEETLLKQLAQIYRTRYVTSEKLSKAEISQDVLETVPYNLAVRLLVFPILFDAKTAALSIVSRFPLDQQAEKDVSSASGVQKIRCFVARPAAIKAAISKFYRGDIHAFAKVDRKDVEAFHNMMNVYERQLLDEQSMVIPLRTADQEGSGRIFSIEDLDQGAARASRAPAAEKSAEAVGSAEILRVMVSLLESTRGELAGHSVQTAYFTEKMCERIGLDRLETEAITMAALLHDLGKGSPYHLTPFNVAEWEGHRTAAEKRFENPLRLFQSVSLPETTKSTLQSMYERFDGQGFPKGLSGKHIPLGARVLAMADTFADLTSNPRNPYRRTLATDEAMKVLKGAGKKIFDANLVELFGVVVAGDDLKRQLLTGAHNILLIDSDPEQCAILDLQLTSRGFKVRTARTADQALKALSQSLASLIVCEVVLEPFDGFQLKEKLNSNQVTRDIPVIYFTSRAASADVEKGFALGAQDYLVKPSTLDVVVAKISKLLMDSGAALRGGVSGSLTEMSLPDLVQVISHGRKNGQLRLTMGQHRGEIHFVGGEVYDADFDGIRGEEAFFKMLRFKEGTFVLNPNFRAETRSIEMTSEMLLLEGMRRFDEESK